MTGEWKGEVGKVEMHDHALTPEEIATLAGKAQMAWRGPGGMIAYWPKDDPPLKRKAEDGVIGG